ncbi:MAG: hypothetical protein K1X29_08345, partial [Bdellovibrionales bacterium]|nr:hypothetical protein [Bdellovibrionales bacterium]
MRGFGNQKIIQKKSGGLFFLLLFSWNCFAGETQTDYLNLSVGTYFDQKIPNAPKEINVTGTFRKFTEAQYNPADQTLRFNPKSVGVGTLNVIDKKTGEVLYSFTIDVRKTDLVKVAREIKSLLNTIDGISIKIANNKVIVDGQILLPSDMKRIHSVVKQYGSMATTFVVLSPAAQNKIAQFIERKINNPEVRVSAVNNKFILEGVVDSPEEKSRAEIVA